MKHYKSVFLPNFGVSSPRTNVKTPVEDFLATVLPRNPRAWSSCTKSNHLLGRKRLSFLVLDIKTGKRSFLRGTLDDLMCGASGQTSNIAGSTQQHLAINIIAYFE